MNKTKQISKAFLSSCKSNAIDIFFVIGLAILYYGIYTISPATANIVIGSILVILSQVYSLVLLINRNKD